MYTLLRMSQRTSPEDAYDKITDEKVIIKQFSEAADTRVNFSIWNDEDKDGFVAFSFYPITKGPTFTLKVTSKNVDFDKWIGKNIIGSFRTTGPLYLFKSKILKKFEEDQMIFQLPDAIFKLQRRQDFRVDISKGDQFSVSFKIKDQEVKNVDVVDVSLGGIGLKLPLNFGMELIPGDTIDTMYITFGKNKTVIKASVEVRYKLLVDHREDSMIEKLGLKFVNLDPNLKGDFNMYINRLFREKQIISFG